MQQADFEFASGWKPDRAGDSLLALFTTAVSRQGRRPGQYLFNLSSEINSGRDTQQNSGSDVTEMNKEY
jgi:hypothetical protein